MPTEVDFETWMRYGTADRTIARTSRTSRGGAEYFVSTVFLGIDHQFGHGPPLLFETMIFELGALGALDYQERYSTLSEAMAGHERAVRWLDLTLPADSGEQENS